MKHKPSTLTEQELYYWKLQEKIGERYPEFDIHAVRVAFAVLFTFNAMEAIITKALQAKGMTMPGLNTLVLLNYGSPEGYSLTELSQFLVTSRANITGVIDSLARKGFVSREDHIKDRRIIMAKITKAGREWVEGYFPGHGKMMAGFSSSLNKKEKQQLIELLEKMRAGIMTRFQKGAVA